MQMKREDIIERLKDILISADARNQELVDVCTESSKLTTDFGFSSVSMLYMVIAIEETFQIQFDDVSMSDFDTLGDVVNYIERHLS